jgi:hypothetical protein
VRIRQKTQLSGLIGLYATIMPPVDFLEAFGFVSEADEIAMHCFMLPLSAPTQGVEHYGIAQIGLRAESLGHDDLIRLHLNEKAADKNYRQSGLNKRSIADRGAERALPLCF